MPSWAPDGKSLACWTVEKASGEQFERLYNINVDDGKMRLLNDKKWRAITGLTYMPNGSMVIVARDLTVQQSAPAQLWLIDTSGTARQITNDLTGYETLGSTRTGDVMVSLRVHDSLDLWLMNGKDASQPRQVTSSGEFADGANGFNWTADGRILFSSLISGNQDIWVMNPDGSGRLQLTHDNGINDDAWMTKDRKYIVFVNRANFINDHIYRMDVDGRNIRQLTNGPLREWTPRLSLDGKWVYYVEVSNASQRMCKVPIDGGEPITIARLNEKLNIWDVSEKDGRIMVEYIPQGDTVRHVVILAPDSVLAEGSTGWPPSAVKFDLPSYAGGVLRFTPEGKYIAFRGKVDGRAAVSTVGLDGRGKPKLMFFLDDPYHGFRWSPDGKQLANVKRTNMSDAIVITNSHN